MSRYAATQVGQYLLARFGFHFTDDPMVQRLEDHIWEAARRAMTQRRDVQRAAEALTEDAGYVLRSLDKVGASPYEPSQRGDFASAVRHCGELEREVSDLIGVHQATVQAIQALRMDLPTIAEHSAALDRVRSLEPQVEGYERSVNELLAAREEWIKEEKSLLSRLTSAGHVRDKALAEVLDLKRIRSTLTEERDAALARVAELDALRQARVDAALDSD